MQYNSTCRELYRYRVAWRCSEQPERECVRTRASRRLCTGCATGSAAGTRWPHGETALRALPHSGPLCLQFSATPRLQLFGRMYCIRKGRNDMIFMYLYLEAKMKLCLSEGTGSCGRRRLAGRASSAGFSWAEWSQAAQANSALQLHCLREPKRRPMESEEKWWKERPASDWDGPVGVLLSTCVERSFAQDDRAIWT